MVGDAWDTSLNDWYGPATPLMWRLRSYSPNRRGQVVLRRWLRVLLLRSVSVGLITVTLALFFGPPHPLSVTDRAFVGSPLLAVAALSWRASLIKIVLGPNTIVLHRALHRVEVPYVQVHEFHRRAFRGSLRLRTRDGRELDFYWFDGSLWDLLYDYSRVCLDLMEAHAGVRSSGRRKAKRSTHPPVVRRYSWSVVADVLAVLALGCAAYGLVTAFVR